MNGYEEARERYAAFGVDTEAALTALNEKKISFNAWQLDDVKGFLRLEGGAGGGVMATGSYPGAAKNAAQLMQDADEVFSLVPGKHKLSLQANMISDGAGVDLDTLSAEHFRSFIDWAKERGLGLDINPSCAGHPMLNTGFTLSSPDKAIRDFWVEHFIRTSLIGEAFGRETGIRCVTNYWIPDGYKDYPADTYAPRVRLAEALDEIFSRRRDTEHNIDTLESKLFGIGVEAYTVGSHEFYMAYAMKRGLPLCRHDGLWGDSASRDAPHALGQRSRGVFRRQYEKYHARSGPRRISLPGQSGNGLFRRLRQPRCRRRAGHEKYPEGAVGRVAGTRRSPAAGGACGRLYGAARAHGRVQNSTVCRRLGGILRTERRARGRGVAG